MWFTWWVVRVLIQQAAVGNKKFRARLEVEVSEQNSTTSAAGYVGGLGSLPPPHHPTHASPVSLPVAPSTLITAHHTVRSRPVSPHGGLLAVPPLLVCA